MEILFKKKEIEIKKQDTNTTYDLLTFDSSKLVSILEFCAECETQIKFVLDPDATPISKKLAEIFEAVIQKQQPMKK